MANLTTLTIPGHTLKGPTTVILHICVCAVGKWNMPICPWINLSIIKIWYISTMEFYSAIKKLGWKISWDWNIYDIK